MSRHSGNTRIAAAGPATGRPPIVGRERRADGSSPDIDLRDTTPSDTRPPEVGDHHETSPHPTGVRTTASRLKTAGGRLNRNVSRPRTPGPYLSERIAIRALDLTLAATLLVLLFPVLVAVAVAIKVDSPGPVFFRSTRVGHRTPTFRAWKFRSMVTDAEAQLLIVLASDPLLAAEYNTYHKLKKDPRLTRVGRLIRKTSLDEVPQLLNVLAGQMSMVGPRPNLLGESHVFGHSLDEVLRVRPGLTGLWQVSGRSQLSLTDRVAMDLHYVRTRTVRGDLRICVKTFFQLCRPWRHGAY